MDNVTMAATFALGIIGLVGTVVAVRVNLFRGVGFAVVCSLLLPTWNTFSVFGLELNMRICVALAAAIAVVLFRARWLFDRLVLADVVVAFLCLWQTFSEWNATGDAFQPFLSSYGYWALPYVVGRCSARNTSDLRFLTCVVSVVSIVFAIVSLVETFASVDLFETVFGEKPGMQFHQNKGKRWGFVRCEGPTTHPIFFGTLLLLLMPWSIWGALKGRGKQRGFAILGIIATPVATLCTISRGPTLGVLVSVFVAVLLRFRKLLFCFIGFGCLVAILVVAKPDYVESFALWFGQISGEREIPVMVGDEEQVKTSSMSRVLQLQHYWKAVSHAGITGYGMTATDTFPPNIPFVPFDQVTRKPLSIIDNSYVLLTLRAGWLQSLAFVLLHIAAIDQLVRLSKRNPELVSFCRLLIGAICAYALVVFTVYPDYDFMFVFLWTVGISSANLVPEDEASDVVAPKRRVRLR